MRGFINGVVFTLALIVAASIAAVATGLIYAGADTKPPQLERIAANQSLKASIDRDTKGLESPIQPTDENLLAAVHLYGNNCAICHGAADGKASTLASGFYIKAPQLASDGVEDDPPSETYWKLKHGIRFTAMPAFGSHLDDTQLWQLALFLSKMDKLPPAVDAAWKLVPSVAASTPPLDVSVPAPDATETAAAAPQASGSDAP
jgi:mono/diheme cytochrome c family protein